MKENIERYKNDEVLKNCRKIINIIKESYNKREIEYDTYNKMLELILNVVEERIKHLIFWKENDKNNRYNKILYKIL